MPTKRVYVRERALRASWRNGRDAQRSFASRTADDQNSPSTEIDNNRPSRSCVVRHPDSQVTSLARPRPSTASGAFCERPALYVGSDMLAATARASLVSGCAAIGRHGATALRERSTPSSPRGAPQGA